MNYPQGVNPHPDRASTRVMAAGTVLGVMSTASAKDLAAQDFADVVSRYRVHIFRFLLASTHDVELAENLTQDCFLKAHRNWARFRGESSPMTWLMRIAINVEKDHWRNRRLQFWRKTQNSAVDLDEASEWLPSGERTAEEQMLAKEQVARVWRAVEDLSGRQKAVFLLRYVEDLELVEIARATGLSQGTVKAHLSRALSKIRTELRQGSND
jgi:RNA polymerase sigma-70 factor (ECF subfamily)